MKKEKKNEPNLMSERRLSYKNNIYKNFPLLFFYKFLYQNTINNFIYMHISPVSNNKSNDQILFKYGGGTGPFKFV